MPDCSGFLKAMSTAQNPIGTEPVFSSDCDCIYLLSVLKPGSCSLPPISSVLLQYVLGRGRWDYDQVLHLHGPNFELSLRHYVLSSACLTC